MDRKKHPTGDAVRQVIVPKADEQIRLRRLDAALLKSQWGLPNPQPAPGSALERNVLEYNLAMHELYGTVIRQMSGDFANFTSRETMPNCSTTAAILGKSLLLMPDAPDMRLLHYDGWQEFQKGPFPGKKSMSDFLSTLEHQAKTRIFDVIKKLEQAYMQQIHGLEYEAMSRNENQPFEVFMAGSAIQIPLHAFVHHVKDEDWFIQYKNELLIGRYLELDLEQFGLRHPEFPQNIIYN